MLAKRLKSALKPAVVIAIILGGLAFLSSFEISFALIFAASGFFGVIFLILIMSVISPTKYTLDQRIDADFPVETREKVRSLLNRVNTNSTLILQNRILDLAKGDSALVERLVNLIVDERDSREAMMYLQVAMQKEKTTGQGMGQALATKPVEMKTQKASSKKAIEKQIKDAVFKEMYLFLKETLLPLGFNEHYWGRQGFDSHIDFTRDSVLVASMHEIRDQFYELSATTDSDKKTWIGDPENGHEVTAFEFGLLFKPEKNEKGNYKLPDKDKRAREYEKFKQWLIENQIN